MSEQVSLAGRADWLGEKHLQRLLGVLSEGGEAARVAGGAVRNALIGQPVADIRKVTVWGNHSATQYPDVFQAEADGKKIWPQINDQAWLENTFIPTIQKRGAAIIDARGASSAASAANAAIDHMRDWALGSVEGDWVSMGVPSEGNYDIPEGVVYGFPVTCSNGHYEIVRGLELSDFSKAKMQATHRDLMEERDAVKGLF